MLKALIFDFDGVIVDTESVWYDIYHEWLKNEYDYNLSIEDYLVCVGSNSQDLKRFLEKQLNCKLPFNEFEQKATQQFIERTNQLEVMPGVKELLEQAAKANLKMAIATSATIKKPTFHLKRLGLYDYFDAFSTAELVEKIKPNPDLFEKAAELLNCRCDECLAIEDSANGLLASVNAKMPCLVVPNRITEHSTFKGYYKKVDSLAEVDLQTIIQDFNT